MSLRRCEKIRAEGSRVIEGQAPSKLQGSELPGRTHANVDVAEAVPVVDVEAVLDEVAATRDEASEGRRGLHRTLRAGSPP